MPCPARRSESRIRLVPAALHSLLALIDGGVTVPLALLVRAVDGSAASWTVATKDSHLPADTAPSESDAAKVIVGALRDPLLDHATRTPPREFHLTTRRYRDDCWPCSRSRWFLSHTAA